MSPLLDLPREPAVAVFCASREGNEQAFHHAAESLGQAIAKRGSRLVYGGGNNGLMGAVSRAALDAGGKVTGITPYAMLGSRWHTRFQKAYTDVTHEQWDTGNDANDVAKSEVSLSGQNRWITLKDEENASMETIVVYSMHDRKLEMAKRSSAFFGLPGGFGTFEELMEVITWSQIGIHDRPIIFLNVCGFYNALKDLMFTSISAGFVQEDHQGLLIFVDGPEDMALHSKCNWGAMAFEAMENWTKPVLECRFHWKKSTRIGFIAPITERNTGPAADSGKVAEGDEVEEEPSSSSEPHTPIPRTVPHLFESTIGVVEQPLVEELVHLNNSIESDVPQSIEAAEKSIEAAEKSNRKSDVQVTG